MRLLAYIPAALYLVFLLMPGRCFGLLSTELALTDKRLIGRVGIFNKRILNLPHKQIETVVTQRGMLGMLFNYGTLIITASGGIRMRFHGIARPKELEQEIDSAIEIAVLGRALPRDDTPLPLVEPVKIVQKEREKPVSKKDPDAW